VAGETNPQGMSCGVQGCLYGAVAFFIALLIALLVIGFFRFQEPPQGVRMPMGGMEAAPAAPRAMTLSTPEASRV
jgi:hypothetical protein